MYAITPILHMSHLGPYEPCKTSAKDGKEHSKGKQRAIRIVMQNEKKTRRGQDQGAHRGQLHARVTTRNGGDSFQQLLAVS